MIKILLVEDNEMNRDMLSRRLERKGYQVIMALDGEQAVAMAASEAPALILMDMSLPVLDGWEATRRIRAGGRQLQTLIGEYFDDEKFFLQRDLHRLYHELRTPVNQIIGYSELLQELAEEQGLRGPIVDLQRIHDAAGNWLALMEAYLIESAPA